MRICIIEGCEQKHFAKGYCRKHYRQMQKYGHIKERTTKDPNIFIVDGDTVRIKLFNKKWEEVGETVVDLKDFVLVKEHKWCLDSDGYVVSSIPMEKRHSRLVRLARFLLCLPPQLEADHRNHNLLDNKRQNLRRATPSQNKRNRELQKNNTSGFKGVYWHKRTRKWVAKIRGNGKKIHLGCFVDKLEAAKAYNKAALEYHGEFAYLNNLEENGS